MDFINSIGNSVKSGVNMNKTVSNTKIVNTSIPKQPPKINVKPTVKTIQTPINQVSTFSKTTNPINNNIVVNTLLKPVNPVVNKIEEPLKTIPSIPTTIIKTDTINNSISSTLNEIKKPSILLTPVKDVMKDLQPQVQPTVNKIDEHIINPVSNKINTVSTSIKDTLDKNVSYTMNTVNSNLNNGFHIIENNLSSVGSNGLKETQTFGNILLKDASSVLNSITGQITGQTKQQQSLQSSYNNNAINDYSNYILIGGSILLLLLIK